MLTGIEVRPTAVELIDIKGVLILTIKVRFSVIKYRAIALKGF
jgi:hypothetical protein